MSKGKNQNKKNNRVKIGIIVVIICGVIGGIVGFLNGFLGDSVLTSLGSYFEDNSYVIIGLSSGIIALAVGALGSVLSIVQYRKAKSAVARSRADEALLDRAEQKSDLLTLVTSVSLIVSTISFMVYVLTFIQGDLIDSFLYFYMIALPVYIIAFVIILVMLQKSYKMNKELNPNLDFNVFDMRIMDTAETSTDEAQRLLIYKAAYKSMAICSNAVSFATVIVFMLSLLFKLTLAPTITLGAVTIFMNSVFMYKQYRVSHPKVK